MNKTDKSKPAPRRNRRSKRVKQRLPAGWTEEQLWQLANHYDNQTEDEAVAEDEAAIQQPGQTLMLVPTKLVPAILKLIARHEKTA